MKTKSILLCLVLLVLTSACSKISSNQVDTSAIYGSVFVDREGGSVNVSDTLFVGGPTGTVVTVDSPAQILINGNAASGSTDIINMTSYGTTLSSSVGIVDVTYVDKNGKSYDNQIPVPGDLWNTGVPGTISISAGYSFVVNTHSGFLADESLRVRITSTGSSSDSNVNAVANATTQAISVSGSAVPYFTPGTGTLEVCRVRSIGAQAPYPSGTEISIQSCARTAVTVIN